MKRTIEKNGRTNGSGLKSRLRRVGWLLLGVAVFVVIAISMENEFGIPFDTTYRIACAGGCLVFMVQTGWDHRRELWPWISFFVALLINTGLFFTPILHRPASRGELLLFALPDAVVFLAARIVSYPRANDDQRATRQYLILALIIAIVVCALVFTTTWHQLKPYPVR